MNPIPSPGKTRLYMLALSTVVLAVYLGALRAGFLPVDDADTIRFVQSGGYTLKDLFLAHGNDYYRPLTILSFVADYRIFGGSPAGYHLTNVLLHLANTLLVFHLARLLFRDTGGSDLYPFLAGLLFAVHPVNSEAVIWISARADLLCCFFALICLILLVRESRKATLFGFPCLFLSLLCSLSAKEASLFILPLAMILLLLHNRNTTGRKAIAVVAPLLGATLVYILMRKGLPVVSGQSANTAVTPAGFSLSVIPDAIAAYGFYLRKLLYPFPLNIAITEIHASFSIGFFLAGIAASTTLWMRSPTMRFPLAFLALSLLPPIAAMLLSLPWTPYAERYLYIPSVAFTLCAVFFIHSLPWRIPAYILVICGMLVAVPTVWRVRMWTKPIPFWQDAVAQSPRFGTVRLVLAAEYLQAGRCAEAESALRQGIVLGLPRKSARDFSRELLRLLSAKKCTAKETDTETPSIPIINRSAEP